MNAREWALIAFTILSQMAVGAFLVLGVTHFYAMRKAGMEQADRLSDRALLSIVVVIGLSLVASLFHLGNPINAPRAVTNLATSWLSREILSAVAFTLLAAIFALMQWRKIGSFALRNGIAWIAAIVGVILIFCQSQIYTIPTQPFWDTLATPILFFQTALLLGALAMGVGFVANYAYVLRKEPGCAEVQCTLMRGALHWIALASIILLGIEFVVLPLQLGYLATIGGAAAASASLLVGPFRLTFILRLILAFLGAGIFSLYVYQNTTRTGREKFISYLVYSAFVIVLVSETLGRFLFYASRVRIGV